MSKKYIIITFYLSLILSLVAIDKLLKPSRDLMIQRSNKDYETEDYNAISVDRIDGDKILYSIPSPAEICFLLKDLTHTYDTSLLAPIRTGNQYGTDFKNTLHLGIYHSDLTYLTAFEEGRTILPYLEAVKKREYKLSKTGSLFFYSDAYVPPTYQIQNFNLFLTQNSIALDKLKEHLLEAKRAELNILVSTGTFIETLYLACKTYEKNTDSKLKNWIGTQAIVLDQLLLLLSFYEGHCVCIRELIDDLHTIKAIYDSEVQFEYTFQDEIEPAIIENGILTQKDEYIQCSINFTNQTLVKISKTTAKVRNKMLE